MDKTLYVMPVKQTKLIWHFLLGKYSMKKVANIARLFDVNKETIKKWCFKFGEHLSPSATVKGQTRFLMKLTLEYLL